MKSISIAIIVLVLCVGMLSVAFSQALPGTADFYGTVTKNANLRSGPGTSYAIIGSAKAGDKVHVVFFNNSQDWFMLDNEKWIAAFLVKHDYTLSKPVEPNQPMFVSPLYHSPLPTPTATATNVPIPQTEVINTVVVIIVGTPTPTLIPTETPTAIPTIEPTATEIVFNIVCNTDFYNCNAFNTWDEANEVYEYCNATTGVIDIHGLDGNDNDGKVCESLK